MNLSGVARTFNHDAFGLAIVIFQLLFMGRHPFVGSVRTGDIPPIHEAIRDFRFVYSEKRNVGMDQPPGTPVLSDFSLDIAVAFEKAFARENASTRPSAMEWVTTLDSLEKTLVQCDKNKLHFVPHAAVGCPWCEMEERLGTVLFVPYLAPAALNTEPVDLGADGFNIEAVWSKIASISSSTNANEAMPRIATAPITLSPNLMSYRAQLKGLSWARAIAVSIAAVVLFAEPLLWSLWLPLGCFGAFAGSIRGARQKASSSPYLSRYVELEKRWQEELAKWRAREALRR